MFRQPDESSLLFFIGFNPLPLDAGELGVEGVRLQGSLQMNLSEPQFSHLVNGYHDFLYQITRFTENWVCANMPLKAKIRYRERNCPSKSSPISSQGFLESCIVQEKKLPVSFFPPMAMIFLSPSPASRAQKTRKYKKRRQVPERGPDGPPAFQKLPLGLNVDCH